MRKTIIAITIAGLVGLSYMATPFVSAWQLRQAVKAGDLATIEQSVDWPELRRTFRASLIERYGASSEELSAVPSAKPAKRSWWQRLKAAYAPGMIDNMLNRTMTPSGLASLFAAREGYRHKLRPAIGLDKPVRALDGTWLEGTAIARFADSFERVERIVFTSATSVEIEVIDRYQPDRHYITIMKLKNFQWKLAGLKLVTAPAAQVERFAVR